MEKERKFRYFQLADRLRQQILAGDIRPGEFLPSEHQLCEQYELSRITVRKSLERLAMEGLIVKKTGQGSMVPHDLSVSKGTQSILRVVAISPSYFVDACLPLILKHFRERHPEVEVKTLSLPHPDFWKAIERSSETGIQADLIVTSSSHFEKLQSAIAFSDLQPALNKDYKALSPRLTAAYRAAERVLAVPVAFTPFFLAYNPLLFRKYGVKEPGAGAHWERDDFIRCAQKLTVDTNGDGIVDQYGFTVSRSLRTWFLLAIQNGVDFGGRESDGKLEDSLSFLHDLLYRYRIAQLHEPGNDIESAQLHPFFHQQSAMMLTSSLELALMRNAGLPFAPSVAHFPFGEVKSTTLHTALLAVPAKSLQKKIAAEFIQTAIHANVQEELTRSTAFMSAVPAINERLLDQEELRKMNILGEQMDRNYMIGERLTLAQQAALAREFHLFWPGMRTARETAERTWDIVRA